jgi:hypothetical protein
MNWIATNVSVRTTPSVPRDEGGSPLSARSTRLSTENIVRGVLVQGPSVVVMSLGGDASTTVDAAANALVDAGIPVRSLPPALMRPLGSSGTTRLYLTPSVAARWWLPPGTTDSAAARSLRHERPTPLRSGPPTASTRRPRGATMARASPCTLQVRGHPTQLASHCMIWVILADLAALGDVRLSSKCRRGHHECVQSKRRRDSGAEWHIDGRSDGRGCHRFAIGAQHQPHPARVETRA